MKKQAFNPYLPSWEYIPDGEPYVFGDRVYVYGSHDYFNGYVFCMGDYVCWSAPVDDLGNWRYEGVIYPKTADPLNPEGKMCLYAPDVTVGPDGRYYLYYVLDKVSVVSVAVCDTPAGKYEFYGYVHYEDGTRLGEKEGDKSRTGAMATVLGADMPTAYGANNHGSIVQIGEDWYIFYHRHTNNTWYSRQGCAEKLQIMPDGSIPQVKITSCGLNGGPLEGKGEYPAYLACNLFTDTPSVYVGEGNFPRVMQDGRDGDEEVGYIANITDSTTIGFKYFDCHDIREISIWIRGYAEGTFEVKTAWDGEVLATLEVQYTNVWEKYTAPVTIPDGIQALYLTYRGNGNAALRSFELS